MTIDPSTLADGTVVEIRGVGHAPDVTTAYVTGGIVHPFRSASGQARGAFDVPPWSIVRTFTPDPLPEQEVPRDEWKGIESGSRLRIIDTDNGVHDVALTYSYEAVFGSGLNSWSWSNVVRVYLLDEPADPDADLIEEIAGTIGAHDGEPFVSPVYREAARAVLAVVREWEAKR